MRWFGYSVIWWGDESFPFGPWAQRQIHLNNDFRGGIYRRAMCEKPEFTEVNEDFEQEHNDEITL